MRDPERIIQGCPSDDAVLLIRAARREAPRPQARLRTLAALGLPTTLSALGKAAIATTLVTSTKGLITGIIVGVTCGSVLATIVVGISQPSSSPHVMQAQQVRALASTRVYDKKEETLPTQSNAGAEAAAATADTASVTRARVEHTRAAERPAPANQDRTPQTSPLAREVAALDVVRAAALAQQSGRVLTLLDAYQRDFPHGALQPEAQVLRVEALARSGQLSQARALAARLLAADPSGPLSHRIRVAAAGSE